MNESMNHSAGRATSTSGWAFNEGETVLHVSGLQELSALNSAGFRDSVQSELRLRHQSIEVDLSEIRFMDSHGLGVLIGLQNKLAKRKGGLKVLNPAPQVQKIFDLTRVGRVFEIVPGAGRSPADQG